MPIHKPEERVLIIAPVGQDGAAMVTLLNEQGFAAELCEGPMDACQRWREGAGALLFTEEALEMQHISELLEQLRAQPPWSELPVIIIANGGESRFVKLLDMTAAAAGSVTVLERPLGRITLLRSVNVALHSRRRQYETRTLLESKARLAVIIESSNDAIISKDLNGIITTWNKAAEVMFGYTAQEAVGQPVTMLILPAGFDEERAIMERLRTGDPIMHYETVRQRKDGVLMDISLTVSPIKDSQGKIIGVSKIARDITARKQTERTLAQAQAQLEEYTGNLEKLVSERTQELRATNEQLEAFVYSIAHDLRAPLRSMIGCSQLLLDDYASPLAETGRNLLQRIQASSEFMDKLLLDLLAFGRAARSEITLRPIEIRKAWETALFQCASEIERMGAQVETCEPLGTVLAHEGTLGQCLANLLSNAMKFVAPGVKPIVRCWGEQRGDYVRIWVEDNGIGIPLRHHERVFRVFERLHGSRYVGTGIGLSIVRKGVERMGGKVGLESDSGKGSRFWIELPKAN